MSTNARESRSVVSADLKSALQRIAVIRVRLEKIGADEKLEAELDGLRIEAGEKLDSQFGDLFRMMAMARMVSVEYMDAIDGTDREHYFAIEPSSYSGSQGPHDDHAISFSGVGRSAVASASGRFSDSFTK